MMFTSDSSFIGCGLRRCPSNCIGSFSLFFSRGGQLSTGSGNFKLDEIGVGYAVVGDSVIVSLVLLLSTVGQHSYNRFSAILALRH